MNDPRPIAVIVGAGKIGRGFLGQLLHRAGYALHFVDGAPIVVDRLNAERRYRVDIAGRDEHEYIPVAAAYRIDQPAAAAAAVAAAEVLVTAVGAANIAGAARFLAPLIAAREPGRPLNWLICENADQPARLIRATLLDGDDGRIARLMRADLGIVETQVLRTGMDADPALAAREPLAVRMHDWWTLPCDGDAIRGPAPRIPGLQPKRDFAHELQRKIFTFNGLNGPIAYLGHANGYALMDQAATAAELQPILAGVLDESGHGLVRAFAFDPAEHRAFQQLAWRKYRDPALADAIERNARDSARKLGARERLIGPAALCQAHGREPRAYAIAIAAALAYDGSGDAGTLRVRATVRAAGPAAALAEFAGLAPHHPLSLLAVDAFDRRAYRLPRA
ncbi:MAG TPA: hypothetical protein VEL07_19610 [Planctomycetota bacterium]|nr:hypothetical protein [Planctomycetota bacterium]